MGAAPSGSAHEGVLRIQLPGGNRAIRACSLPSSSKRHALKRSLAHPDTASDTGVAVRSRSNSERCLWKGSERHPAIRHPNHYVLSGRDGVPHVKADGVADHPIGAVLSSIEDHKEAQREARDDYWHEVLSQ